MIVRGSMMAREVEATPEVVAHQERGLAQPVAELVARLRRRPPNVVVTCARGSSGHAATFAKHMIERHVGLPVSAAAPSIASVYGKKLQLRNQLILMISQSGMSDDLILFAEAAKGSGALTAAITNGTDSPLASRCDIVLPLGAGLEQSVAATKTFVASVSALLQLTAAWTEDRLLHSALRRLPQRLAEATSLDWGEGVEALTRTRSLVTLGRGPTFAMAREAALKLKETCNLHAEAFSGAEFLHGPIALASRDLPVLMLMPNDEAAAGMRLLATDLARRETTLLRAELGLASPGRLPVLPPDHPDTDAVCLIQTFYSMAIALADRLGVDVDRPRNLVKVTSTT